MDDDAPRLADAGTVRQFVDTLFRYASPGNRVSLRGFYEDRGGAQFDRNDIVLGEDFEELVRAATAMDGSGK